MTRTIYNPETGIDCGWPRADDSDVQGLQPPLVVLDVVEQEPPDVPDGFRAERTRIYDLQAGQRIDGWELVELPPEPEPEPEPQWVQFADVVMDDPGVAAVVDNAPRRLSIALGVGLGQAAQGDAKTFGMAWTKALSAGLVTPELAAHVQGLAADYDLPGDFVAGLNPEI